MLGTSILHNDPTADLPCAYAMIGLLLFLTAIFIYTFYKAKQ